MSDFADPKNGPTTEHAFEELLVELVRSAHENGVDVEGGWGDRSERPETPNWSVEIYEIV